MATGVQIQRNKEEAKEVLRLIALGHSRREIAEQLKTDAETVAAIRTEAMQRLGLKGRIDIVRYAEKQGWME